MADEEQAYNLLDLTDSEAYHKADRE